VSVLSALLLCVLSAAQGNRSWWGEVRLAGPLESVRFDCGADGEVVLATSLVAGEETTLALPFPVRSPLGRDGLATLPRPEVTVLGAGRAEFLRWSSEQPSDAFERLPVGLRARAWPPARGGGTLGAEPSALLLVLALSVLVLALRRRPAVALALAAVGAFSAHALALRGEDAGHPLSILDLEAGQGRGLRSSTAGELDPLPANVLEVEPGRARLVFALRREDGRLSGTASSPTERGARLVVREVLAADPWSRDAGRRDLAQAWVRGPEGAWCSHGAWASGRPLPPAETGDGDAPGWLKAGLPPGRDVLLGRFAQAGEGWLRQVGF